MKNDDAIFMARGIKWLEGYEKLLDPFTDTDILKNDIADAIWNDERLSREDIKYIARKLLKMG